MSRAGRRWRGMLLGVSVALGLLADAAAAQEPSTTLAPESDTTVAEVAEVVAVPTPTVAGPIPRTNGLRKRVLTTSLESLAEHGYVEEELFVSGEAGTHLADGEWESDGKWDTTTDSTSPYRTRVLVRRPADPAAFNGTVVVSWLDVTGAFDADEEWAAVGDELMRAGSAFVAVSTQQLGVSGPLGAAAWDATRYGSLRLADDALSYDVFSQVGQAIKQPAEVDPLGGLPGERRLIASGRSQAAQRLVTYINAFHLDAQVYDGFLLASRFSNAAPLGAAKIGRHGLSLAGVLNPRLPLLPDPLTTLLDGPADAAIRDDVDVPVLVVQTETEVAEAEGDRQADSARVRTWEVAGGAHLDDTMVGALVGLLTRDFPSLEVDQLTGCENPNEFPTDQALRAAQRAISTWVAGGVAPASATPIAVEDGEVVRDDEGNAIGGVRLPAIEVPTAVHTGVSDADGFCALMGSSAPFDADELLERYPSHEGYVAAVVEAAADAVGAGHLLQEDADAIVAAAASSTVGGALARTGTAAGTTETGAAAPSGATGAAGPDVAGAPVEAAAPEASAAERSPGWMATTGWNLIAPLLGGLLLLVNGRVVLTIANERKRGGSRRDRTD